MCARWLILLGCLSASDGERSRHAMMIDAGSEGSRLYLFRWAPQPEIKSTIVVPEDIGSKAVMGGVASFALNPKLAGPSLAPLLAFAEQQLQHIRSEWHVVPVYLRATAGMRLLSADEREAVLDSLRGTLRACPFLFKDDWALVATGEEEGIFGWLTVNHRLGNLNGSAPLTSDNSVGSLDLGGASVQIVFIPEKSIMSHAFNLRFAQQHIRVYSVSFLHYGLKEAAHLASDVIISNALMKVQSVDQLYHPCFSKGYNYHPRFGYSGNRSFPIDVKMAGTSNYLECKKLVKKIIRKDVPCLMPSCSFYGVYQPHLYNSKFIAFSHFGQIAEFLALPEDARLADLRVATEYVCSLSMEQLNVIFGRVQAHFDRVHLCFHASYILTLLDDGFGFTMHMPSIRFRRKLGSGSDIDYVVGAMIYEVNQDPWLLMSVDNASALTKARFGNSAQADRKPLMLFA